MRVVVISSTKFIYLASNWLPKLHQCGVDTFLTSIYLVEHTCRVSGAGNTIRSSNIITLLDVFLLSILNLTKAPISQEECLLAMVDLLLAAPKFHVPEPGEN